MFPVATLTCAILAGCTGSSTPGARTPTPSPSPSPASSSHVFGPPGSAANPLALSCDNEVWPVPAVSPRGHADLVIGPLDIVNGKALATYTPAEYGYNSYGHGGRFYKVAVVMTMGATATVTVAPPAAAAW